MNPNLRHLERTVSSLRQLLTEVSDELGEKVSITISTATGSFVHVGKHCWYHYTYFDALSMLSLIIDSTLKGRNSDET